MANRDYDLEGSHSIRNLTAISGLLSRKKSSKDFLYIWDLLPIIPGGKAVYGEHKIRSVDLRSGVEIDKPFGIIYRQIRYVYAPHWGRDDGVVPLNRSLGLDKSFVQANLEALSALLNNLTNTVDNRLAKVTACDMKEIPAVCAIVPSRFR